MKRLVCLLAELCAAMKDPLAAICRLLAAVFDAGRLFASDHGGRNAEHASARAAEVCGIGKARLLSSVRP